MFIALATLAIIFWLFYYFFIKGNGWPILFFIFGVYGGKLLIVEYFPSSGHTIMTFMNQNISYAAFFAAVICILAIGVLMEKVSQ